MENKVIKNSVLIVDDDNLNIVALTHILGPDYKVYSASNGPDGIKIANEHLPDVVLLDIVMPGMDGHAVLAELKKSPKTQQIPVIFVTAIDCEHEEEKALTFGASDYITKPFVSAIVKLRVQNQMKIINQMHLIIEKEIAEKSSHAKFEFLSNMSHDMLTPMNAIVGLTQILKLTHTEGQTREYLDDIDNASKELLGFLNKLLNITED
ncbi:MAG: response regulator [Treponema sp.]|nr:response regulator [Treponema sp.]